MREYGSMTDANLLVYQVAPSHGGGGGGSAREALPPDGADIAGLAIAIVGDFDFIAFMRNVAAFC